MSKKHTTKKTPPSGDQNKDNRKEEPDKKNSTETKEEVHIFNSPQPIESRHDGCRNERTGL